MEVEKQWEYLVNALSHYYNLQQSQLIWILIFLNIEEGIWVSCASHKQNENISLELNIGIGAIILEIRIWVGNRVKWQKFTHFLNMHLDLHCLLPKRRLSSFLCVFYYFEIICIFYIIEWCVLDYCLFIPNLK